MEFVLSLRNGLIVQDVEDSSGQVCEEPFRRLFKRFRFIYRGGAIELFERFGLRLRPFDNTTRGSVYSGLGNDKDK